MKLLLRYLPIVVVLLIAGVGTYVGMDSISSNPHLTVDEEAVSPNTNQPAPAESTSPPTTKEPPQTTTTLPRTTTTTTELPATTRTSPEAVVEDFYAAINARNFARAWELGGKNLSSSYRGWVEGYADTLYVTVTSISSVGDTVYVTIDALQNSGEVQRYSGSYTVRGGAIVSANVVRRLAQNPFS